MRRAPRLLHALIAFACLAPAAAPAADDAGASTFRGQKKRYAPRPFAPEEIVVPRVTPKAPENLPSVPDPGPGDAQMKFAVRQFEVSGNTLLPPSKVDEVLKPYLRDDATIADVQAARDALQKAYDEEFITVVVSLPQQSIAEGQVRLDVVENRLGTVTVSNEGVRWFSDDLVRRDTPRMKPGAVLRKDDLSEDMNAANRNADRTVRPVLRAGESPGTADLTLLVEDRIPLHGSLAYDNEHSPGSPGTRATAELSYANLWGLEHTAAASFRFAADSSALDVQTLVGSYAAPMPWDREQQAYAYAVRSISTILVPGVPFPLFASTNSIDAGARYLGVLPGLPGLEDSYFHSAGFGFVRKDFTIGNEFEIDGLRFRSPGQSITYLPFNAEYNGQLLTAQSFHALRLGLSFNFAGMLPGGTKADFQSFRGGDRPGNPVNGDYQIFSWSLDWTQRLPAILMSLAAGRPVEPPPPPAGGFDEDWTFHVLGRGQVASQPLIVSEQFSAGGVASVRGYLEAEVFGDDAFNIQAELRSPYFRNFLGGYAREAVQLVAFYDGAKLFTLNDGISQASSTDIQGWGVGLRARFLDRIKGYFFIAHPRTATLVTGDNEWRYHFLISAGF